VHGGTSAAPQDSSDFFRQRTGQEPARDWLRELPEAERQAIGKDLMRAQWRWPIGMPLCRPLVKWALGDPDGSADETDGARAVVPLPRTSGRTTRAYQEIAYDAGG